MAESEVLTKHLQRLYGYALALTSDVSTAEDMVQEAYLRALAAKRMPDDERALRAWLFRILRNAFFDYLRREQWLQHYQDEDAGDAATVDSDVWLAAERALDSLTARQAFNNLRPSHREIVTLIDVFGLTYAEAADVLETPIGTVMSRLSRARGAMLEYLAESNVVSVRARRRTQSR
jgi:RNA polymerase sigma-70 factor (ECF subfamily)